MKKLTINEQIFLIAICHLNDEAYGVKIREKIMELTGSEMLFGTIYNTLEYLVRKEYVTALKGKTSHNKDDNKRVYYRVTDHGQRALQEARELQNNLWQNFPERELREIKR
ncbi:PadR family transcriptional regulator [Acidobacteriota bacterium]